jgi:hypothetical protein
VVLIALANLRAPVSFEREAQPEQWICGLLYVQYLDLELWYHKRIQLKSIAMFAHMSVCGMSHTEHEGKLSSPPCGVGPDSDKGTVHIAD